MANISLRKLLESALNVEDAAEDADKLGLTHKSFGRYYDDQGQYVAKSVDGNLVKVSGDQPATPDRPPTKLHPSAYRPVHPNFKKAAADLDAQRSQDAGEFDRPYSYEVPDQADPTGPKKSKASVKNSDTESEPKYGSPGHPTYNTMNKVVDWDKEEKKAKSMDNASLEYAIKDALAARDASKGWNANGEGYYQDQASVYARELRNRKEGKSKEPKMPTLQSLVPDKWDDPEYLQQSRDDAEYDRTPNLYGPDQ